MCRAFLATFRDDPSSSTLLINAALTATPREGVTVLRVDDLAPAIARVEADIRSRVRAVTPSKPDLFDALVATDDCSGPALYRPYIPTPVPPAMTDATFSPPILVLDRDAFYHPAGLIPGFADMSGRDSTHRISLTWVAAAFLAPLAVAALLLLVLAAAGIWSGAPVTQPIRQPVVLSAVAAPPPAAPVTLTATPASVAAAGDVPSVLVVDVNSLKSSPPARLRHRR